VAGPGRRPCLVGLFADPHIVEYLNKDGSTGFSATGLLYGNPMQLAVQAGGRAHRDRLGRA